MFKAILNFIRGCVGKYTWFLILVLVCVLVSSYYVYKSGFNDGYRHNRISDKEMSKIISACLKQDSLISLETKIELSTLNEKISGVNTRFDDLYVLGSIILALIGVILASVYIKSETEVKKHLDDNFENQKKSIQDILLEAERMSEKIKASYEVATRVGKSKESGRGTEPDDMETN